MTLADLRRLAVKKQLKLHFRLKNGMECIVNEEGVAQIPTLRAIPDFNLEEELAHVTQFTLDPVITGEKSRARPPQPQNMSREELSALAGVSAAEPEHQDHDE